MKHILLIDDEKIEAKLVDFALKKSLREDYKLYYALTGPIALEYLKQRSFDLILLDNLLPNNKTAIQILPKLLPYCGNARIAIISNIINDELKNSFMAHKIDDIVDKFFLKEYFQKLFPDLRARDFGT